RIRAALAGYEASPREAVARPFQPGLGLPTAPIREARAGGESGATRAWPPSPVPAEPHPTGRGGFFGRLRYIGQARASYLLLEGDDGLYVLDQHAAHERVTFERLRGAFARGGVTTQRLLIPVTADLERSALAALLEAAEGLAAMGLELSHFGGQTLAVTAVPELLAEADIERLVRDLADELRQHGSARALDERRDEVFACMACHNSVRAADALEPAQVRALLEDLDRIDLGANCPHGRPVVVPLSWTEIDRRLHRT
ncbi:MAG: DNA mismatch repair protein MutL, partial [Myxococcales bacterium]|nr:DNA mismatch repair protein MutL [Myxococcales bacterium]